MKVLLNIDQKASLMAGLEAPSSTMVLDIPKDEGREYVRDVLIPLAIARGNYSVSEDDFTVEVAS